MTEQENLRTKSAFFNLLRFIGAFCIAVFLHYDNHFLPRLNMENPFAGNPVLWGLSRYSGVFVEMFFIISGILFAWAYKGKIESGQGFDAFFGKRVLRIFPLVAVTSVTMYIGNVILYRYNGTLWSGGTLNIMELLYDILFGGKAVFSAPNTLNGPIWYISILMTCYILAYILTRWYKKVHSIFLYVFPIFLGVMIQYSGKSFAIWNGAVSRGFISFFIGVLLGIFLEWYEVYGRTHIHKCTRRTFRFAVCLELIVAVGIRFSPLRDLLTGSRENFYAFLVFPGIILLCYDCKWLNRLCSTKFVTWLGNISFGMYLWNFPIFLGLHLLKVTGHMPLNVTSVSFLVLVAALHIMVSGVSYRIFDCGIYHRLIKAFDTLFTRREVGAR